ncbi:hypothetical protein RIF29_41285 [Crotalaria pallida]|uniref:LOB domain-containing protein n=1 Tax=Crotalaria pallida TaxID=3830 RepID=A0AAN9E706_CROPI
MKDFFPSNKAQDFEHCKQLFGAHNILKRISEVEPQHRANCVESMIWEARSWKEDPVNGAFARYKQLLATYEEVMAENSILKSQGTAESFGFDWDGLLGEPSMGAGAMQQLHFTDEQQQQQGPLRSMEQLDSCYQQQDPIGYMEQFDSFYQQQHPIGAMEEFQFQQQQQQQQEEEEQQQQGLE